MLILRSDTCLMLSILFLGYLSPREGLSGPGVRGYCCCPLNVFSTRWIDHVNLPSGLGVQGGEFTYVLQPFDWQLWVRSDHHCPSLWVTAVGPRWSSLPLPLRALNSAQGLAALAGQHRTRGKGWIFLPSSFPISFFEGERWRRGFWSWPLRIRKSVPEKSREQRVSIRSSKKKALFGDRKVEA